jgi:DNA-directed RNA polymerases I and III subunit RPAC2
MTTAKKLDILPGSTENSTTYLIKDEDHTLGNVLKSTLLSQKGVVFAGYSVPHPSERIVSLRIQTTQEVSTTDALKLASTTIYNTGNAIMEAFDGALK